MCATSRLTKHPCGCGETQLLGSWAASNRQPAGHSYSTENLARRPGRRIFSTQSTFKDWAFHHGARTGELQFNIGREENRGVVELRYGVAFSFETSRTLPSDKMLDVLTPKVKLFNDFIRLNAGEYDDMRMWHYANGARSSDSVAGPIAPELVVEGVFVFLGNRQPASKIDYKAILNDFDRLLPLYKYVESEGTTQPVTLPTKTGFAFKAGCTVKASSAKATQAATQLDVDLRHNDLQMALYRRLVSKYGKANVGTEIPSGVGTSVDVVVRHNGEYCSTRSRRQVRHGPVFVKLLVRFLNMRFGLEAKRHRA